MNSRPKARKHELPFVFVNMAMTADGKIATANRAISTFGSPRDHEHLLELRATADAVMAGATTVNAAPINLGTGGIKFRRRRLQRGLSEHNLRVIASGSGSMNPQAEVFRKKFSPVIILTTRRIPKTRLKQLRTVAADIKICGDKEINFRLALRWLKKKWRVRRLLCEGGGELNDALFRAGLVDEINLTICPKVFGGRTAPTIVEGRGFQTLTAAQGFKIQSMSQFGDELFTVFSKLFSIQA